MPTWCGLEQDNEELLADMCEEVLVQARQEYDAAEVTLITPRVTGGTGRHGAASGRRSSTAGCSACLNPVGSR